jgi:hypothetical protein
MGLAGVVGALPVVSRELPLIIGLREECRLIMRGYRAAQAGSLTTNTEGSDLVSGGSPLARPNLYTGGFAEDRSEASRTEETD